MPCIPHCSVHLHTDALNTHIHWCLFAHRFREALRRLLDRRLQRKKYNPDFCVQKKLNCSLARFCGVLEETPKQKPLTGLRRVVAMCFYKHNVLTGLKKPRFSDKLDDECCQKLYTPNGFFSIDIDVQIVLDYTL